MLLHHTQGWPFGFRRDVTSELDQVFRDFSRIMGDGARTSRFLDRSAGVYPLMNVSQDGENYYVRSKFPVCPRRALRCPLPGEA